MRDLIVLHRAWHQPAHFEDVVGRLRQRGLQVSVPDLAGHALQESTRLVQEIVDSSADAPVVMAHSNGAVTAAGLRGVAHLLFLNAWVLDAGETPQDWIVRNGRETGRSAPALPMDVDDAGVTRLDPAGAREGLYADCTEEVAARAIELLRPEPGSIFGAAPERAAWKDTPSTYVAGSEDRAIPTGLVAYFADRCGTTQTWPTSHSPYLSRPQDVVELALQQV